MARGDTPDGLPPPPDFDSYPVPAAIAAAAREAEGRVLRLDWSDGRTSRYHAIWLRDNATDAGNLNLETREQRGDLTAIPEAIAIAAAEVEESGALAIAWTLDEAVSRFHPGWLYAHDYTNPRRPDDAAIAPTLWDGAVLPEPPSFEGTGVLEDDGLLEAWLRALAADGIARLRNVAAKPGMVARVAERVGPVRETNFGRIFDVRVKAGPGSNAYTALALSPHTDLPTREYQPGLQFLHCLRASPGGRAIMVDGFKLAERIEACDRPAYRLLSEVLWPWSNRAPETDYRWQSPVISLDPDGSVREIRAVPFLRAPLAVAFDRVEEAYRALRVFYRHANDPALQMRFDYLAGDLVVMDNRRVLHGREAYDPRAGARWLQGCYGEREELLSRLRILARRRRAAVR